MIIMISLCVVVFIEIVAMFIYASTHTEEFESFFTFKKGVEVTKDTPQPVVTKEPVDPTHKIATFLQGPKSFESNLEWSGEWGKTTMDGGSFGAFGCGLCCMANVYCTYSDYSCSPVDMYKFAKKKTGYYGGGAIAWGYLKKTMTACGFSCDVGKKPKSYENFKNIVLQSKAMIVNISSNDSTVYWKNTPGHYITILAYDKNTDKIFLGDSGNPKHNRHWVELKKIYKSIKKSSAWHYLYVTGYNNKADEFKHKGYSKNANIPEYFKK